VRELTFAKRRYKHFMCALQRLEDSETAHAHSAQQLLEAEGARAALLLSLEALQADLAQAHATQVSVGCGVQGVGCGVWGVGCGVYGAGCRVRGVGRRV